MADSGARGSDKQIKQLAGMRGLMADTTAVSYTHLDVYKRQLGQHGVNIVEFTKQFNAKTADQGDLIILSLIHIWWGPGRPSFLHTQNVR